MFYAERHTQFKTSIPFPLVLKGHSSFKKPTYVIDNECFTIVFFSHRNYDYKEYWEVSFRIKDHEFCDKRINEFKVWYSRYYHKDIIFPLYAEMEGMPEEYLYPVLNPYESKVQDFCIEFWNTGRDFMLFKLMDLLRLF